MPNKKTKTSLSAKDFRELLRSKAVEIAPSDVTALVGRIPELQERISEDGPGHPQFAQRLKVALHLLADHSRGACPQIPLQTVALLSAALYYYLDPVDVIPDVIPGAGVADDALMLELAWQDGEAGIRRYLSWKDGEIRDGKTTKRTVKVPARKSPAKKKPTKKPSTRR